MAGKSRFERLFEPYHIGPVKTRNRMLKSASGMGLSDEKGFVKEKHKRLYEALAKGGVGLIVVEGAIIEPYEIGSPPDFLRICHDEHIPGLSELTQLIHKYNCPGFLSLWSNKTLKAPEIQDHTEFIFGDPPPFVRSWLNEPPPPDISIPEIKELVERYAVAAERAKKAGFDGVEIHAASQNLFATFLSRAFNGRQDVYGPQSIENRARILVDIIQAIKNRVGKDFPVSVLINAAEYGIENGITIEESRLIAKELERAGADAIEVRAWGYGEYSAERMHIPDQLFTPEPPRILPKELDASHHGAGLLLPLAAAIKKMVSIPVIAVGRFNAELGEQVIRKGQADFIAHTRRLLADPEYPNKIASGREDDIAPCTACMTCFGVHSGEPLRCRVNAFLGSEHEYVIKPAEKKKNVLVIGGGPAGMEAARVCALRGHDVTLFEKERKLGGLLPLAGLVKGLEIEDITALTRYLGTQIAKLGVKIVLGKEADLPTIEKMKPDAVILAMGGMPSVPKIPGINGRIVVSGGDLHHKLKTYLRFFGPGFLRFLTKFWMPLGKRVVVIGGDIQGSELAEFLVKRGRRVTLVDTSGVLGEGIPDFRKIHLFDWLAKKGATMMTGVTYKEITDKGLTVLTKEGKKLTIEADTIVPVLPLMPNNELAGLLKGKVSEVYAVGDCSNPRLIVDAVADGFRVARSI